MKILAIGSEGNIGAPLVRHLREVGHDVYTVDIEPGHRPNYSMADINHPIDLLDAFDWGPEVVYLMAAVVSRVTCEQSGSLAVTTNLAGTNNILQLVRRVGARLVFFSTSEVYGPTVELMDERTSVPRPNNRYGLTKWLGEQLVDYEWKASSVESVIIRPFMVYDENEDLGDHRSAMIRFAQHFSEGVPADVHVGSARSWLHISDAVVALERASNLRGHHVINVGHPDVIKTEALAQMIIHRLDADPQLMNLVEQPGAMTMIKRPALHHQSRLLHVDPLVGIEDGIARVCRRWI
jgi:nucleoside-diphosphate-sugar epimerase